MGVKKLRDLIRKTEILDTDIIPIASSTGGLQHAQVGDLNLLSDVDKVKFDGIEAGAQKNTVTSVSGRTGAIELKKSDVGLGLVDNTSDANKPISNATQTALNEKLGKAENAASATKLATPRKINGVLFDGTQDITIAGGGSASSSAVTLVTWTEVV